MPEDKVLRCIPNLCAGARIMHACTLRSMLYQAPQIIASPLRPVNPSNMDAKKPRLGGEPGHPGQKADHRAIGIIQNQSA